MKKEYAVIFKTKRNLPMPPEYNHFSEKLLSLAQQQEGFLRIESVSNTEGMGISISYWRSLDDIKNWRDNITHLEAQEKGKIKWYQDYKVEICEVIRSYAKNELER